MKIKILAFVLLISFLGQVDESRSAENGVLKIEDFNVIMTKWSDISDALKLDDWSWDLSRSNLLISMHDGASAIHGKYRSYLFINPDLFQIPQTVNRLHAAEAATLHVFVENLNRIETKWKSALNLEEATYNKSRQELDQIVKEMMSRFKAEEIDASRSVAQYVVAQLVDVVRKNPEGILQQYDMGTEPGQFRYEPGIVPDTLIKYVGAQPFAACDFSAVTSEMKRERPAFDDDYVAQIEELRCLSRSADADGNAVQGPGCPRAINSDELKSQALGYASFDAIKSIYTHLSKTRNFGFLDYLRARNLALIGGFDSTLHVWSMRPFMNHWRPASAMRSGSGHEVSLWPIEPDWNYRDPDNFCEPEYPSGNASNVALNSAILEGLFSEDQRNFGIGRNTTMIDGEDPQLKWSATYKHNGTEIHVVEPVFNLDQFSKANEDARVFSGAHFRFSVRDGTKLVNRIGHQIWNNGFLATVGGPNDKGGSFLTMDGAFRFCAH